jgi:acyl carrier protein
MDILKTIVDIVAQTLGIKVEEVKPESKFVDDLKADELDLTEIVMEIENALNIRLLDEEIEKITTIKELVDYTTKVMNPESGDGK